LRAILGPIQGALYVGNCGLFCAIRLSSAALPLLTIGRIPSSRLPSGRDLIYMDVTPLIRGG